MSDEELDYAMAAMDTDGNGDISLEEFTAYLSSTALNNVNVTGGHDGVTGSTADARKPRTARGGISRAAAVPEE